MTHENRVTLFSWMLILGSIIVWTPLLHPLHEWGHVLFAGSANVTITGWSTVYFQHYTYAGLMGGYWTQLALGSLAMLLFVKYWPMQGLGLGYISMTFIYAFLSADFDTIEGMGYSRTTINLYWMIAALPVLALTWGLTLSRIHRFGIKSRAPKSDASTATAR